MVGFIKCKKCKKSMTYPCFKFLGKGQTRKGSNHSFKRRPGSARGDVCYICEAKVQKKKKPKLNQNLYK